MPESTSMLQGSYVYLLIFQVVLVTGLMLAALWLIVRRMRTQELAGFATPGGPGPQLVSQREAAAFPDPELEKLAEKQTEKIQALEKELALLEQSTSELKEGSDKTEKLREKIRYLEQKLLEYEILQEEISSLSHLKSENARLRTQLEQAGLDPAATADAVAGEQEVEPEPPVQQEPVTFVAPPTSETPPASDELESETETVAESAPPIPEVDGTPIGAVETPAEPTEPVVVSMVQESDEPAPPAEAPSSPDGATGSVEQRTLNPFLKEGQETLDLSRLHDPVVSGSRPEPTPKDESDEARKVASNLEDTDSEEDVNQILTQLDDMEKKD